MVCEYTISTELTQEEKMLAEAAREAKSLEWCASQYWAIEGQADGKLVSRLVGAFLA